MKKVDFLDLVCAELARMGVEDAEIRIQRQNMDRYLTGMGIGEESPALDGENPAAFAKLIYGNIAKKQSVVAHSATPESQTAPATKETNDFAEEMPNVETVEEIAPDPSVDAPAADEEDDVKIFSGSHVRTEPVFEEEIPSIDATDIEDGFEQTVFEEDVQNVFDGDFAVAEDVSADVYAEGFYDEQSGNDTDYAEYSPLEEVSEEEPYYEEPSTEYVFAPQNSNGTIEFDVSKIKKKTVTSQAGKLEEEEDYFEKNDDEDYNPSGNPALFWVLVVLTSFLWIPLLVVLFATIAIAFVFMLLFEALFVPSVIAIIIGGSAISFAELIYSIIKFAGKNPAVALFELGLGLLVAALTFVLPTVMYYMGVSIFPRCIKNYGKSIKKLLRKLRRLYRKLKGVCSI